MSNYCVQNQQFPTVSDGTYCQMSEPFQAIGRPKRGIADGTDGFFPLLPHLSRRKKERRGGQGEGGKRRVCSD